jgi:alpha-glucosidase
VRGGLLLAVAGLVLHAGPAAAAPEAAAVSPDGAVRITVFPRGPRLHYAVTFKGRPMVEPSPLVLTVDGVDLTDGCDIGSVQPTAADETYPWRGVHSKAVNHYAGAAVGLTHAKSNTHFTLELRAFDAGAAFRCTVPGGVGPRVPDEATSFTLPAGSTVWYHDLGGHYEGVHVTKAVADVKADEWAAPPLTVKLPDGAGYAAITEAALVNYSGMALQADGRGGFRLALGHKHPVSYPFRLRYHDDIERVSRPAAVTGPITTPWRVVTVGADLNALVNADVVPDLCPPPDPALFPQGTQTDWVKPGRAVWKYLDGGASTPDGVKEFSRLAGELGFEYQVVEGFWSRWTDAQIKDVVDYSRQRGVGLWFWRHSRELRTPEKRAAFFEKLHTLGVVGAKIDFFDHEHREVVDLYLALLREAAKNHVLVNFHGANKPTGEPRTWPNELVREGVKGMEASKLQSRARHDATLPFTRFLAGAADYTPVHFGARRADTTWAHQVATAAVFTAPLLTYAAHPKTILDNPCAAMIKSIPAVWDETIVLPVSEIGEVAAFARRRGDTWFLAVVNGPAARTIRVPLTFLGGGAYQALLVRDHSTDPAAVRVEDGAARRGEVVTIDLRDGGGFIARYSKDGQRSSRSAP